MTERPILFSAPMVRALLENRKTQTRRTRGLDKINAEPAAWTLDRSDGGWFVFTKPSEPFGGQPAVTVQSIRCPYGVEGDRLWTREAWTGTWLGNGEMHLQFAADGSESTARPPHEYVLPKAAAKVGNWVTPLFLPRWVSRDTLEVISARPERLQSITEADAIAEGIEVWMDSLETPHQMDKWCNYTAHAARWQGRPRPHTADRIGAFAYLIDSINPKTRPFANNYWAWRLEFKRT